MKNLLNNLLNWVLKKGSSETKKEQAGSKKEQAGSKKEQAEQKGNKLSKKGTSLEMNPCVRGSEVREVMGSEAVSANHALITQLSRNNHPISLRAIRYAAVLFMVLMVGIGNVWSKTWNVSLTGSGVTQDGITLTGDYAANASVGSNSKKANSFNTNNSSAYIFSEQKNITAISFTVCRNTNGNSANNAVTVATSTGGAFAVQTSNFTATNNGSSISSLTNIQAVGNNQATQNTIVIAFAAGYPVQAVELRKASASLIFDISVTYEDETLPSSIFNATISGSTPAATVTPAGTSLTLSVNSSSPKTIGSDKYYQWNGDNVISLGSGKFQAGDIIIADVCGSGNNKAAGFKVNGGSTEYIVTFSASSHGQVLYTVSAGDGVAGQSSVTLKRKSSDTYVHAFRVLRSAPACTSITPSLSYTSTSLMVGDNSSSPTLSGNTGSGAVTWTSSNTDVATVNSSGVVTAEGAGSATITASIAANGGYCEGSATANFTVTRDPVGEDHVITYVAQTGTDVSATLSTASKNSTSSYLTSLSNLTLNGLTITDAGKENSTPKIQTPESEDASKYLYLTFNVASGYQFTITQISTKLVAVTDAKTVKCEISDNNGGTTQSLSYSHSKDSDPGTVHNFAFTSNNTYSGTVTVKLYVYGATSAYRLGKPLTITGDVEAKAAPSCTAPDHVDISGDWDKFGGETISLTATAYSSAGTGSPIADGNITGWQWQKLVGSTWTNVTNGTADGVTTSGATTKNLQISNCSQGNSGKYRCVVSTGATCSTASATATDGSEGYVVKVYALECYTSGTTVYNFTRDGNNQRGSVSIALTASTGYAFKIHADKYYGNDGTINFDENNWTFTAAGNNVTVNSGLGGTFTFTIDYSSNGDVPVLAVTYPRKRIYLEPNSDWLSNSAKFAYYYFHKNGGDTDADGWTDFLSNDDCGRYADIPQWNGVQMIAVRFNSLKASTGNWDDKWNQTSDLTVTSNDLITITGWDNSQTYNSTYSTPTYTIGYAKGSVPTGGGSISGSKSNETKTCGVDFTLPSSAVFTTTGYTQTGWTTSDGGAQEYALGGTYTTNEDKTFYPVWTVNNYNLTWNLGGGTTTSVGTGIANGVSSNTTSSVAFGTALTAPTVTKANYTFSAWSPTVASTMPAEDVEYTATWTANQYSVTHSLTGVTTSSGATGANAATYGTNYSAVLAADDGYTLPATITVTAGATDITANCTWNSSTGAVSIPGSYITGNITITAAGVEEVVCPASASGAVVYKWEVKSNVTDGNICSTQNVAVSLNTTTHLTTLTGGTLQGLVTSSSMNNLAFSSGRIQYAIGTAGVLILTLDCAVKTGDVIRFVNYSSNNSKYNYLRHTSSSTTTNQITLNANNGAIQEIVVPSAFNDKDVLYIVAGANTTGISYFEIIRPYVVTLDASTNGGKVGGANTATYYAASGEEIALPHAFKSDNYFNGWFPNASTGDAVSNPYTPTGSTTLYAQFGDCPDEGTVYKFQVATGLTNENVTEGDVNLGNYVSALEGGSLTAHQNSSKLTIVSNSKIQFADNNVYLKIDLDCALQTGDKFITSIETDKLCITNTGSRSTTNELVVGTKTETDVPAAFVGSKTLWIWRNGTNSKITYFEIVRTDGVTITGAVSPDGYGTVSPASIFVASGSTVSLASNALTCDGKTLTATPTAATAEYTYAFSSWSGVTNGGTVSVATTATANFTRTANSYTLTWSSNGGSDLSGSYTSGSTAYGAAITAPNDPTLSNYTFEGWKTNNDGTGTTAGATMPAANTTYYAAWKQTVTLTTGAQGEGGNQTPYVYKNGTGVNSFTAHTATGYTLQGYYTAGSGGVKVLNADGTFASANVDGYITSSKWSRTGAAPTLYAQWLASEDCSTSDFVIRKGDATEYQGCMESSSYNGTATSFTAGSPTTVGKAKMTISNYSDGGIKRPGSGNTFTIVIEPVSGYYLKSVCWAGKVESGETVSYYWDDASGSATTISAQTTSGTGVTYNAPNSTTTKFTASYTDDGDGSGGIWWRNVQVEVCAGGGTTYRVTYDGNGASGSAPTDATAYSYGAPVTVLGNTGPLAMTNYTFAGWSTNNDGTGSNYVADNTFSITANTTLYAKWTQAVTLNANTANHGSTGGSATAVWNATGLTGITHAKPANGYKLTGYYTAATAGTKVLNSDGTFAATTVDGYVTDGKWSRTGTAPTLYAQYESAGALTWNLIVNSDTANLSTSTKTSAFTEISTTNMTNATLAGDLTYEKSKKSALTGKISTPASYDADDYVYVTFQVASGYKFTPSSIKVIAQPVTTGKDVKLSLTDGALHSLVSSSATSISSGSTQTVTLAGDGTYFTGTVTLKIYCYGATDKYRLGTPITIEGEIEEACGTMPSYTSMSYTTTTFAPNADASGSPITIVGGTNIDTYQWKYNTVNDRTSGTNCGTGTSLTPLTDEGAATNGTRYYWCEMTNDACGITIKSPAVAITVAVAKSDATVTWNNPASTPNYGGGGYTIKATVDQSAWNGNAADLVISAPAGINIYNVTPGTDGSSRKYVQADFDVQTSFDRTTYASNIPFSVSAAATATYNAISDDHNVSYSACAGAGEGSSYNIRMRKTITKDGNYYHSANTDGWISPNISSSHSTAKAGTTMATDFDTVASSNTKYVWVRTYHANVNKVRIYADFRANDMTVSNVYKHTDYFSADSKYTVDYTAVYNGDEENENTGTAAQGYVDITLDEVMAANDILLVKFNDNKVRPLGAVITEGSAGSLNTYLQWSGGLKDGATVDKYTTDAYFTYSASKITENTNTLGAITYSSSNTSVATVDATGKVALVAAGETTIKATLAASGCYKKAEISYTLNVTEEPCAITAGTLTLTSGTESKCSSDNVTLTLTGFESGASIQWKDGDADINNGGNYTIETDGTTSTLTTSQEGTYSVMVTSGCSVRSNRITISNKSTEVGAKRIVKNWYIKNGRQTPDIELWTLQNGAHLSSVAWSQDNATGLTASDFYESDGKVYLKGKEPSSNTSGADINYTLTLTVEDDCGSTTTMSAEGQLIYLHHQKNTDKHVLAFVVTGTEKGGFTEGITAAQTTSVELYNTIAANFDVLATNVYSTDDEQALKEYYSQFDILCVTDYPNTGTKGVNKKSYVDALGALVDIRPILTMEAFVAKLANWKAKGISGTPQSPTTRQYTMLLQCKDHEIFSGTKLTKVGEGDETMYRVSMVDNTQEEYVSLDATYGDGAHADESGYEYASKPALQGFTFTEEMLDNDLLPLGLIDDGSGNDLQVGIERQTKMEARLMVLGINSYAMERLTSDGQTVVVNALKYLMKKNSEDIADCSNTFVGGDDEEDESTRYDWNVDSHWSGNAIPERTQKVRIVAPCVINANEKFHVTGVVIAPSGKYNHGANTANGSLTIAAGGALIVDGKVEAATAPYFTETRATSPSDLTIQASSDKQGALILDNEDGKTNATVEMYSASHWEVVDGKKKKYWSYVALPVQSGNVGEYFYNGFSYLYDETVGWIKKGMYAELHAFEGLGISMQTGNMEYFHGALAPTTTQEITLTKTDGKGEGENLIGNSWTAPIQIANFDASDFGEATATVYVYNTGRDEQASGSQGSSSYGGTGSETAGQWVSVPIATAKEGGYTGLKVIPAMNAFQVTTSSETTLTLDYDKLVRGGATSAAVGDLTVPLRAPKRSPAKAQNGIEAMMCVRMSGEKTHADVWLQQDERFSNEFDNGWEATYVECDNRSPQFYAQSEIGKMAFLALPDLEGTVLGLAPSRDGNEYSFTFHYVGEEEFYLNDLKLHDAVLINEENSYEFTYSEGDTNRFYISRTAINAPTVTTGVGNTRDGVKAQKILYNNKLYIIINGRVYSAEGALVK